MNVSHIGKSVTRVDVQSKTDGSALYIDDICVPQMIHGLTVRSRIARGILKSITYNPGVPWDEITVVTAADVPGMNVIRIFEDDQPFLVNNSINHPGEAIVLLAHADLALLKKAGNLIEFEVEELPAVFDMEKSLTGDIQIHAGGNVVKEYTVEKGDVSCIGDDAHIILEEVYHTGAQEQLYIEPQGMIAQCNSDQVVVHGSMQCPYYVHRALCLLFDLPAEKVRIVQTVTGGAFGGKEDYPSVLAGHAALLSMKAGLPVKMIYSRSEDLAVTTKRHPSRTRHRTTFTKEGKLLAMEIDYLLDAGAYTTLTPVVLSRGTLHSAGPYNCPNTRILAKAVATNTTPFGAFRGFGAPQSCFAVERQMDLAAAELGMDPVEIRRINLLKQGDTTATGQVIHENINLIGLMDEALEKADYYNRRKQYAEQNLDSDKSLGITRGIGLSTFYHGAGFTGSGESYMNSKAGLSLKKDGKIEILTANTEMGQGLQTVFTQIAAEALGTDLDQILIAVPDTDEVPDSGPTVASRSTMVVGRIIEQAAADLLTKLQAAGYLATNFKAEELKQACKNWVDNRGDLKLFSYYQPPDGISWDEDKYSGDAYGTFAWAVYIADVSIDRISAECRVDDFFAAQEIGRVVNPQLAEGQIEGGVAQGIGMALYEKVVLEKGQMINNRMTNYIMPSAQDLPEIKVIFSENPYKYGPGGAKGIGELPLDGTAAAIFCAVDQASGVRMQQTPLTTEDLMSAMDKIQQEPGVNHG
jgi:CO/xanthine dehydrogenase Mo-binding subunit